MRLRLAQFALLLLTCAAVGSPAAAQNQQTGYAVRKPVIGGACPLCPWGAMSEIVKKAMEPYGWDIQICYVCAGGPREARMVAGAMRPERRPPPRDSDPHPLPNGPIDFGVTGSQFLQWAYLGMDVFANDPEGPRRHLRMVANIQEPTWLLVAVKSDSGITSLSDIVEKRLAVDMVATTGIGGGIVPGILNFYGLSKERVESFGGTYRTGYEHDEEADVIIGFGSMVNAPEYRLWYEASQKFDLKYLELAPDLRAKLAKDLYLEQQNIPLGLFRGVDRPIPTVARTGAVIYGRTDMPDEFAYTLAKAMDEHQDLLQWTHMNFSYNWRTVWKAFDVPLHPGAARYYKERGYMK
jgi:TRAP transporter TAXI family solute receptor